MIEAVNYIGFKLNALQAAARVIEDPANTGYQKTYLACRQWVGIYALKLVGAGYNDDPVSDWALLARLPAFRREAAFDAYVVADVDKLRAESLNAAGEEIVARGQDILTYPPLLSKAAGLRSLGLQEISQDVLFIRALGQRDSNLKAVLSIVADRSCALPAWEGMTPEQKIMASSAGLVTDPQGFVEQIDAWRTEMDAMVDQKFTASFADVAARIGPVSLALN